MLAQVNIDDPFWDTVQSRSLTQETPPGVTSRITVCRRPVKHQVTIFATAVICRATFYRTQWTAEGSVFGADSLWIFCLCMKYLGNSWTDLRQIHMEDVFSHSLAWVWRSRSNVKRETSKVKVTRNKRWHFSALSAVCVRFMFGKTSLAFSLNFVESSAYKNRSHKSFAINKTAGFTYVNVLS